MDSELDKEIKEIKRLSGITEVFMQGGTPTGDPLETIRRQIAAADEALASGDAGRVKAIFREIQHVIMAAQAQSGEATATEPGAQQISAMGQ